MSAASPSKFPYEHPQLAAIFSKVIWRITPFLCCCYLFAYLDRINVGFAKLQMLDDLGFSEAVYGLGAGIFFIGYILLEVPSNMMLERIGARIWIARIMITWGIISTLSAFVTTPAQFYTARFLLGAAEAGFVPGILYYLTRWFPSYRRGRIVAFFMLGLPLSTIVGGPLSGWIMSRFNQVHGLAGWQWLFVLEGVPSIALGVLTVILLPNGLRDAKWLSAEERRTLDEALVADSQNNPHNNHRWWDGLLNYRVWMLGGIDFSLLLTTYALSFWMPTLIRSAGVADPLQIGLLTAIPSIAGLAGMLLIGASSDRRHERRWHIIVPFLIAAGALAASTRFAGNDVVMTVALFSLASAMVLGAIPPLFSLPATFLRGPAAAVGFALVTSIANIAGLLSNSLMGLAIDLTGSSTAPMLFFASILLVGAGIAFALPSDAGGGGLARATVDAAPLQRADVGDR